MVFSFAVAILIASRSISRGLAFATFVGSTSLHGALAVAFTSGLHAAFYASMGFMARRRAVRPPRPALLIGGVSGSSCGSGEPGVAHHDGHLHAVGRVQFGQDTGQVSLHRGLAHVQLPGNVGVGQAASDLRGDLALPVAQPP